MVLMAPSTLEILRGQASIVLVRSAPHLGGFFRIPRTAGQPTIEAIGEVLSRIRETHPSAEQIVWINLRYVG